MSTRSRTLGAVALACLAVPAAAHASVTKTVYMGSPPALGKALQKSSVDVDAFFPQSTTIHKGDKIRFVPQGFHDVDLPKRGTKTADLFLPTGTMATENDAAGVPFWFNGAVPNLGFNPALVTKSLFGKTATYNGSAAVNTGLPIMDKPKPATITFTKLGSFTYYCDVHPGMKATVHVVNSRKRLLSPKAEAARVKRQSDAARKAAAKLNTKTAPTNTINVGQSGPNGVELLGFVPSALTVPVGTTVKFDMPRNSREDHTATTGPGNPESEPTSYLGALANSFQSPQLDPAAVYPSDAPGAPSTLNPTSHGNGFWNSGVMDAVPSTATLPGSKTVTFTGAGTYTFYCLIHPFMKTTVTVTG